MLPSTDITGIAHVIQMAVAPVFLLTGVAGLLSVLVNRLRIEGFIVSEHMDVWPAALEELGALVADGRLKYRETVAQGLDSAPDAFIGLLLGRNVGKQLVGLL